MTNQGIEAIMLETSMSSIILLSINAILFAFIVKIRYRNSSFEYLKILSSIILLTFTIFISIEVYKIEQIYKLKDRIITIKTSNLNEIEKNKYIKEFEDDIKSIQKIDVTIVFGIAKFLLLAIILNIIIDISPDIKKFIKSKLKYIKKEKQLSTFDMSQLLDSDKAILEYLSQILENGDQAELFRAVGYIAKAKKMT